MAPILSKNQKVAIALALSVRLPSKKKKEKNVLGEVLATEERSHPNFMISDRDNLTTKDGLAPLLPCHKPNLGKCPCLPIHITIKVLATKLHLEALAFGARPIRALCRRPVYVQQTPSSVRLQFFNCILYFCNANGSREYEASAGETSGVEQTPAPVSDRYEDLQNVLHGQQLGKNTGASVVVPPARDLNHLRPDNPNIGEMEDLEPRATLKGGAPPSADGRHQRARFMATGTPELLVRYASRPRQLKAC
ncbi:hypothetical protein EVAR_88585_1 [Eumeta japonica]|uniref:Uncharacterized protein n=1 Tax=Eumeta variegata TaxID=151549 RepID=A0A4C1YA60_EUMVA|nr:hypothetical protein EVAR_88585_1 [Eumeta japonica]